MMEIPLFQSDESMRFERIILYPYPDLKRVWTRIWITPVQGRSPDLELVVLNPDGSENASVYMMARREQRAETTIHLRNPLPGATYRVIARLTQGMADTLEELDRQEFDLVLEFRDPEKREPGFGMGVDWDAWQREAEGSDKDGS